MTAPVVFTLDAAGLGWIVFDAPGAKPNVVDQATQEALAAAIDAAVASGPRAVIVIGAKEGIFIAGAELRVLQALPDTAAAEAFSRKGQALYSRLAALPFPVVVAIRGACAGGGYELALACDWRLAADDPTTRIGLPEVGLGTIPGWGGCTRLPRLIGAEPAVDHILRAQLCPAAEALGAGLIDELAPVAELRMRAAAAAERLIRQGRPQRPLPAPPDRERLFGRRKAVLLQTRGRQPAAVAAIDVILQTATLPLVEALDVEAAAFGAVTAGAVCKNLIHGFFLREAARKRSLEGWFAPVAAPPVRTIGVVGAGVMGSGIAHWLAARGFSVVLRDVAPELLQRAQRVVVGLVEQAVQRGRANPEDVSLTLGRIRTTTGWEGFAECDLVIEAIVEDVAAKRVLFSELAGIVREDAVLASNTSALPIEEIAGHDRRPERTVGIHFFNPVSRMALVELIIAPQTSAATAQQALTLVRALGKSAVICRSSPGFLVTRVLFFYLNAAVRRWEEGASTAEIDDAMREFGWPMGPLRLIDEVGIDVTAFIFGEMARYFPGRFTATTACEALLRSGLTGRKNGTGRGFYRYEADDEHLNDEVTRAVVPAPRQSPVTPQSTETIRRDLMAVMKEEARRCLAEGVVRTADDVDFALNAGAGFPAFRGGLLHETG